MDCLKVVCLNKELISIILIALGLLINLIGTCYLSKGLLLKDSVIQAISGTFFGSNPLLEQHLQTNRKDAKKGFVFLGIGFIFQLIGLCMELS
jgi:hypothetical protein